MIVSYELVKKGFLKVLKSCYNNSTLQSIVMLIGFIMMIVI